MAFHNFYCEICKKKYKELEQALRCQDSHDELMEEVEALINERLRGSEKRKED